MEYRLDGFVALVTGSGQGLGRAIALEMASQGAALVVTARRKAMIEEAAGEIVDKGGRACAVVADVGDRNSIETLIAAATDAFGKIDILVNNAAFEGSIVPLLEVEEAELRRAIEVNLFGVWHLCRAVLPGMMERTYGRIMNLMGPIPEQPGPLHTVVAATKGAVLGLTRSMAAEVAVYNITVNALCAGAIRKTEMADRMYSGYGERMGLSSADIEQLVLTRAPQQRWQELDEVAGVAAYLASPAAGAITAQSVKACGGMFV